LRDRPHFRVFPSPQLRASPLLLVSLLYFPNWDISGLIFPIFKFSSSLARQQNVNNRPTLSYGRSPWRVASPSLGPQYVSGIGVDSPHQDHVLLTLHQYFHLDARENPPLLHILAGSFWNKSLGLSTVYRHGSYLSEYSLIPLLLPSGASVYRVLFLFGHFPAISAFRCSACRCALLCVLTPRMSCFLFSQLLDSELCFIFRVFLKSPLSHPVLTLPRPLRVAPPRPSKSFF